MKHTRADVSPAAEERQRVLTSVHTHTHTREFTSLHARACVCVLFADDFVTIHHATVRRHRTIVVVVVAVVVVVLVVPGAAEEMQDRARGIQGDYVRRVVRPKREKRERSAFFFRRVRETERERPGSARGERGGPPTGECAVSVAQRRTRVAAAAPPRSPRERL